MTILMSAWIWIIQITVMGNIVAIFYIIKRLRDAGI